MEGKYRLTSPPKLKQKLYKLNKKHGSVKRCPKVSKGGLNRKLHTVEEKISELEYRTKGLTYDVVQKDKV